MVSAADAAQLRSSLLARMAVVRAEVEGLEELLQQPGQGNRVLTKWSALRTGVMMDMAQDVGRLAMLDGAARIVERADHAEAREQSTWPYARHKEPLARDRQSAAANDRD